MLSTIDNLFKALVKIYQNMKDSIIPTKPKVLFIVKERVAYGTKTRAYGLYNSCQFVAKQLHDEGYEANVVQVIDNNCIDKVVTKYKPTHCFIEALWVVPSKFEVLAKLHPKVKWIIRIHSMIPFLSSEGMAFEWMNEYIKLREKGIDISLSCNNAKLYEELKVLYKHNVSLTPNIYYPEETVQPNTKFDYSNLEDDLHIGCFGALRILKNQTQQAFWAIEFADEIKKTLHFHVNISEHEQKEAGPILRNLRAIFANTKHKLVEHLWYEHPDFLELVKKMDIGMQVSFTETFNIVAADFVYCHIPIVVSEQIQFIHPSCRVDPAKEVEVKYAIRAAYYSRLIGNELIKTNLSLLEHHNNNSIKKWLKYLKS